MMYQLLTPLGLLTQRIKKLPYLQKWCAHRQPSSLPVLTSNTVMSNILCVAAQRQHATERSGMGESSKDAAQGGDEEGKAVPLGKFRKAC